MTADQPLPELLGNALILLIILVNMWWASK